MWNGPKKIYFNMANTLLIEPRNIGLGRQIPVQVSVGASIQVSGRKKKNRGLLLTVSAILLDIGPERNSKRLPVNRIAYGCFPHIAASNRTWKQDYEYSET